MISDVVSSVALAAVLVGNGALTAASVLAWSFSRRPIPPARGVDAMPGPLAVAIVRPLHGPDPSAGRNNAALLAQRHAGHLNFVFVASRGRDPGLVAARAAHGGDPRVACIVSEDRHDATDKAAGMIAGWRATTAPFVAFCDADVHLDPDTLTRCMALFDADDVAGVFSPALHIPSTALQRLVTMITSGDKVVTVRALERVGQLRLMEGGLMVVRRAALDSVGSIEVLHETIADDLRLATVLTAAGFRLRAGPVIPHAQGLCGVASFARQYHRWMLCQRVERPWLLGIQLALHAIVAPLVACGLNPSSAFPPALLAVSVVWRVGVTAAIERAHLRPHGLSLGWWVLARPLADLVHVVACASAFVIPTVRWGERTYRFRRRFTPVLPLQTAVRCPP